MKSWIYVFAQFTPEALLFEALVIFFLICGYTTFWVLKKRRYGVIESALPAGPVKSYLNELIGNAEQLRIQLFGLLSASGGMKGNAVGVDSGMMTRFVAMEAQLAEQTKALDLA